MARSWMIAFFFFLLASTVSATSISANNCPNCSHFLAEARGLVLGESLILIDGEDLIFLYRAINADIERVWNCCGIQENLSLLDAEAHLWGLRYPVPHLDEAIIGYSFSELKGFQSLYWSGYQLWRGENAPTPPPYAAPLQGRIAYANFQSQALNASRGLTIYYPPDYASSHSYPVIYMVDGQSLGLYAPYLERLIVTGEIPPMLLLGVDSSIYRMEEYLPSIEPARFAAHEQFFTAEIRLWAEANLGASNQREERGIFGFSNGGVFAASMALLHPDIYGIAFPFSAGMNPFEVYPDTEIATEQRLYFTAGTLEAGYLRNTNSLAKRFAEAGANVTMSERIAGHDFYMWQEEFYYAVQWAFGA